MQENKGSLIQSRTALLLLIEGVSQVTAFTAQELDFATRELSDVKCCLQVHVRVFALGRHHFSQNSNDEVCWAEQVKNPLYQFHVTRLRGITFEGYIAETGLWSDVNRHVFTIIKDTVHGVTARVKEVIVDLDIWHNFVDSR